MTEPAFISRCEFIRTIPLAEDFRGGLFHKFRPSFGATRQGFSCPCPSPGFGGKCANEFAPTNAGQKKSPCRNLSVPTRGLKIKAGNDLLSRAISHVVPSALGSLTSEFGMGSGVTFPLLPPAYLKTCDFAPICAPPCVFLGQRTVASTFPSKNTLSSRSRHKLTSFTACLSTSGQNYKFLWADQK